MTKTYSLNIEIIPSHQIDYTKWNNCINQSSNSLIYANAFYLDTITDQWHGLIIDDYDAVMPLPWRKKWGIQYLYTPPFIQQLGLFGNYKALAIGELIVRLHKFAPFGDYKFNFDNQFIPKLVAQDNYILDLSIPYQFIAKQYHNDLAQNLKKANKAMLLYSIDNEVAAAISLYRQYYAHRTKHVHSNDYKNCLQLCITLHERNQCFIRKVTTIDGELLAIALLLKDEHRIYNLLNTTTAIGRKLEANHFLIDRIIYEFAEHPILLDFEGSNLPGVKSFYQKFGTTNQPYFHWHHNQLKFPLNLFKR